MKNFFIIILALLIVSCTKETVQEISNPNTSDTIDLYDTITVYTQTTSPVNGNQYIDWSFWDENTSQLSICGFQNDGADTCKILIDISLELGSPTNGLPTTFYVRHGVYVFNMGYQGATDDYMLYAQVYKNGVLINNIAHHHEGILPSHTYTTYCCVHFNAE